MSKITKDIEKLQKEMKDVKAALGLDNNAAKNINMLLETIRFQGEENKELVGAIEYQNEALNLRNEFINQEPGRKATWEFFLKGKENEKAETQKPGNAPALEIKEVCAPHRTDTTKTICGELRVESQMVKDGDQVTCQCCIDVLNSKMTPMEKHDAIVESQINLATKVKDQISQDAEKVKEMLGPGPARDALEKVEKELEKPEKKPPGPIPAPKEKPKNCPDICGPAPAEPVAAPEDEQPQDAGGKIQRK